MWKPPELKSQQWICSFLHMHPFRPSFKLAAWLPRSCRAPSQPAHRDAFNRMAPPLRLSGGSPDSRSGDAMEA